MVSIVVPVYNAELFLAECIESIRCQSYCDWELILVNDGSQDKSLNICNEFEKKDKKIRAVDQKNAGPSAARNKGVALAQGDYITFIDADDYVDSHYLAKLLKPFMEIPKIQLSCGGYVELSKYYKKGLVLHDFQSLLNKAVITRQEFLENIFLGVTGVLWGKMFLTNIIKKNGILLDVQIKLSEDLLFIFEYIAHIEEIALVRDPLYYYNRLNENGLSRQLNKSNLKDIELTNYRLAQLGSNIPLLNLEKLLLKRYISGVLNITKDIANGKNGIMQKLKDLKFIFSETEIIMLKKIDLSIENKILLNIFRNKQFVILIVYSTAVTFLRKLKHK